MLADDHAIVRAGLRELLTATGEMEVVGEATNGHDVESRRLAEIVNSKVVAAIRAHYNPDWPDRGLRTCNGCKGETRLAGRPALQREAAFVQQRLRVPPRPHQ